MFLPDIGLYKVGLRLKASESSQRCEGRAVNSAKRCQEEKKARFLVIFNRKKNLD